MRCTRCVMDDSVPHIEFDAGGECNYCKQYDAMAKQYPCDGSNLLCDMVDEIKRAGKNNPYDCVVGISGGCDSSYLLDLAVECGLRPLAVHCDNGWNTEIAEHNMYCVLDKLHVGHVRFQCNRNEYDNITREFLYAGVPEIDAPADVALAACAYKAAEMHNIKYILNGHSFRTEGVTPPGWFYFDGKYIDSVSGGRVETFPNLWIRDWLRWIIVKRIKHVRPLYYVDYNKEDAKQHLHDKFGWKWYNGHHKENMFTEFCDDYYLYARFGIDLRLVEYSALVRSGQMNRDDALKQLESPPIIGCNVIDTVCCRLGLCRLDYTRDTQVIGSVDPRRVPRSHSDYETYRHWFKRLRPLFWVLSKFDLVPQTFYDKYTK